MENLLNVRGHAWTPINLHETLNTIFLVEWIFVRSTLSFPLFISPFCFLSFGQANPRIISSGSPPLQAPQWEIYTYCFPDSPGLRPLEVVWHELEFLQFRAQLWWLGQEMDVSNFLKLIDLDLRRYTYIWIMTRGRMEDFGILHVSHGGWFVCHFTQSTVLWSVFRRTAERRLRRSPPRGVF